MTRTLARRMPVALVTGIAAGALGLVAVATPAHAVSGNTGKIAGTPVTNVGLAVWYDSGTFTTSAHSGTPSNVSLTATQSGSTINFTLTASAGPVQASVDATANSYRLDAYVRLDGAKNTRGTQFAGPVGTVAVPVGVHTFAGGATVTGSFTGVSLGAHTLTLSDLVLNSNGPASSPAPGSFDGAPMGFDAIYNSGTNYATIVTAPTDWPVTASTDKVAPVLTVTTPKKPTKAKSWKKIKGTATDASGTKSVTVKLSQKRSDGSYIYTGKKWKKGKAGNAKAVAATVSGSSWSVSIKKPGKGKMTIKYSGTDKVGNTSAVKTYKTKKLK